jgi:hypothetical protein
MAASKIMIFCDSCGAFFSVDQPIKGDHLLSFFFTTSGNTVPLNKLKHDLTNSTLQLYGFLHYSLFPSQCSHFLVFQ